jgi:hypothetical protein
MAIYSKTKGKIMETIYRAVHARESPCPGLCSTVRVPLYPHGAVGMGSVPPHAYRRQAEWGSVLSEWESVLYPVDVVGASFD